MPITLSDAKKDFYEYSIHNQIITDLFENVFILSLLVVLIIFIIIIYVLQDNIYIDSKNDVIKIILYGTIIVSIMHIFHDNIIKKKYSLAVEKDINEDFKLITAPVI